MIDKSKVDTSMNDKLEHHHGLQLSALMDGELAPDEARFLLRRLQHDGELADRWERWQLAGEVLRGRAGVLLPDGFAGRVGEALRAGEVPATPARRAPGLWRWGGLAALAASVAVVALMVPRPAPDAQVAGGTRIAASEAARAPAGMNAPGPDAGPAPAPVVAEPSAAETTVGARALASNDRPAPSPAPAVVASRPAPSFERGADPAAPSQLASQAPAPQDPFSDAPLVSRPWPRAVLPQFANGGALAAGLPDNGSSQPPSFYPFEPRLPASVEAREPASEPEPSIQPQVPY